MSINKVVEHTFFFGLLILVGYYVWRIIAPFASALALSAIIVTICYPMYIKVRTYTPRNNQSIAALISTFSVLLLVIVPIFFLSSLLLKEVVLFYNSVEGEQYVIEDTLLTIEDFVQVYIPAFELDITQYLRQGADWLAGTLGSIFKGTASTIFLFFIALIGTFYFFRDGARFTMRLVHVSPLQDVDDRVILSKLAQAVRSVTTGILFIAVIQGVLTAIGLFIFGFDRAILWGAIATIGAVIPGVGTTIVLIPAIAYLLLSGSIGSAIGLLVWGILAVGLIDNLLGPYIMSRGSTIHPFIILLGVLGGIILFGPIGFIIGPVIISLFMVLIEISAVYMKTKK